METLTAAPFKSIMIDKFVNNYVLNMDGIVAVIDKIKLVEDMVGAGESIDFYLEGNKLFAMYEPHMSQVLEVARKEEIQITYEKEVNNV